MLEPLLSALISTEPLRKRSRCEIFFAALWFLLSAGDKILLKAPQNDGVVVEYVSYVAEVNWQACWRLW